MNTYSFNNHALLHFHETVKDAIDPNGILSAGRYGIWPKHVTGGKVMKKLGAFLVVALAFVFAAKALPAQEAVSRSPSWTTTTTHEPGRTARIRAVSQLLLDVPRRGRRETGHARAAGEI